MGVESGSRLHEGNMADVLFQMIDKVQDGDIAEFRNKLDVDVQKSFDELNRNKQTLFVVFNRLNRVERDFLYKLKTHIPGFPGFHDMQNQLTAYRILFGEK